MKVSFTDCKRELLDGANASAQRAYAAWRERPGYEPVVEFVEGFTHEFLYRMSRGDVLDTIARSEHALGEVESTAQLPIVEDFTCPFALQHIFHDYIETRHQLPTWQEFRGWIRGEAAARWYEPLKARLRAGRVPHSQAELGNAIRWRLGKFYYSAIREIDLLARLREEGNVQVRYHLFADVLLRVDFWRGHDLVCTYFPNPKYRTHDAGRKPPAARFFQGTRFRVWHTEIRRQGFGKLWLASDEAVRHLAGVLNRPA